MLMTYDEIRHCLKNSNGAEVSRTTKLTPKTLSCLRRGHVKTPSYETLVKLTEYFKANPVTVKGETD